MSTVMEPTASGFAGGIADVDTETTIATLPVTGTLPSWLRGSLFRNGPARSNIGNTRYEHWFDGLAMVHRFTVSATGVSYASRFLRTGAYAAALENRLVEGFATRPRRGFAARIGALFRSEPGNNANVSIVPHTGDTLVALTETPGRVAFDAVTLETREILAYADSIQSHVLTAHPHHNAEKRLSVNLATEFGRTSKYHIVSMPDGSSTRTLIGSIPVAEPAYMHTFATTERYAIVAEFPFVVRPFDIVFGSKAFIENYRWQPERGTRFHVMRKSDGTIAGRYQAEACFAFHHVNAFEEGDAIVLDMSAYPSASVISDLRLDRLEGPRDDGFMKASLRRYRLEPGRETCSFETITTDAVELPRLNPRSHAKSYRFVYGLRSDETDPSPVGSGLVKVDVSDRSTRTWHEMGTYPGEPVFVAAPGAIDEDDGALLSVVFDAAANASFLLVLDARSFREIARVNVPHRVPLGFHGTFCRAAS